MIRGYPCHIIHTKQDTVWFSDTETHLTGPGIKPSVTVDKTLSLNANFGSVKLSEIDDLKLSMTVSKTSSIYPICDALDSMNLLKHQQTEMSDLNSI